jgi:hypothetical protein
MIDLESASEMKMVLGATDRSENIILSQIALTVYDIRSERVAHVRC